MSTNRVRIVTDSACDLPHAVADELGIEIVPLTIRIDGHEYVDRADLTPVEFWAKCAVAAALPETAAPSPGQFEAAYRRLVKKANIPGFRKGKAPRAVLERDGPDAFVARVGRAHGSSLNLSEVLDLGAVRQPAGHLRGDSKQDPALIAHEQDMVVGHAVDRDRQRAPQRLPDRDRRRAEKHSFFHEVVADKHTDAEAASRHDRGKRPSDLDDLLLDACPI